MSQASNRPQSPLSTALLPNVADVGVSINASDDGKPSDEAGVAVVLSTGSFFSSFQEGGRWGTVFNMCAAILGAGVLSLPRAMAAMGVVPGVLFILVAGVLTHFSVDLLISAIRATNTKSFEDLTYLTIGQINGRLVELSIVIFQLGTLAGYTVAIGDILSVVISLPAIQQHAAWLSRDVIIVMFWSCLMLPLSFVEQISSLQGTSLISTLALTYLVIAVAVHFLLDASAPGGAALTVGKAKLVNPTLDAISASAIFLFAFTCQVNVPSLYDALQRKTPAEMSAVSKRAVLVCAVFYLFVGLTGYFDFPDSTEGNLLNNYCLLDPGKTSLTTSKPPRVILAAFFAISLTITMAYPINVYPTRYTLDLMVFRNWPAEKHRRKRHIFLTLLIATVTLIPALVKVDISVVFELSAGTTSAYVCYCIPAACAWRLRERVPQTRTKFGRLCVVFLFVFGVVVGVLSTTTTIIGLVQGSPPPHDACNSTRRADLLLGQHVADEL